MSSNLLTCNSDYADQVWIWDSEDGSSFYFDVGEIVRLRVEMEEWHDQIPNAPDLGDGSTTERKPPYSIIVSLFFLLLLSYGVNPYADWLLRARCKWLVWDLHRGGSWCIKTYTIG